MELKKKLLILSFSALIFSCGENAKQKEALRKATNEVLIQSKGIKINPNLPMIESDAETKLRTAEEVAQRVVVLATTNMVAFNGMTGKEAEDYLRKYGFWQYTTPNEKAFLANPTPDKKNQESWKCEDIWTLMWALKIVDTLGFPNEMCDLNMIPADKYPLAKGKDPNDFVKQFNELRSMKEILDVNDLYYRLDWTCVDARLNNKEVSKMNPGVVYERHYALNWLINYMNQAWDDITTDT